MPVLELLELASRSSKATVAAMLKAERSGKARTTAISGLEKLAGS